MSFKKRHRKKQTSKLKNKPGLISFQVLLLTGISCLFAWSLVSQLFLNDSKQKTGITDYEELISKNSYEENTGHKITMEILNGCGQPKAADMYQSFLRHRGYDVWKIDNAKRDDYEFTEIQYHPQKYKDSTKVKAIDMAHYLSKETMGISDSLIKEGSSQTGFNITLIIGRDFKDLSSYNEARRYYDKK